MNIGYCHQRLALRGAYAALPMQRAFRPTLMVPPGHGLQAPVRPSLLNNQQEAFPVEAHQAALRQLERVSAGGQQDPPAQGLLPLPPWVLLLGRLAGGGTLGPQPCGRWVC